jgi:outer membrane protein TolC
MNPFLSFSPRRGVSPALWSLTAALALTGCASLTPDEDRTRVTELAQPRLARITGVSAVTLSSALSADAQARVNGLLRSPLTDQAAVQIALIHSPVAHVALARLGVSDAERVLASTWPAPTLSLARLTEGDVREIERGLHVSLLGLLILPMQSRVQNQLHEAQRLQTAQELVRLAADVRKAWVRAVAAGQSQRYLADALEAAQASAELAQRMQKAGHWSALQQQREQLQLTEAQAQWERARHAAVAEREALIRLLGLADNAALLRLPDRLPDLPTAVVNATEAQSQALRDRLDVQAAQQRLRQLGDASGLENWKSWINRVELGYQRNTSLERSTGHREVQRGWEFSIPLPIDGAARSARTDARLREAAALWRQASVNAASEAREAHSAASTALQLARQYRQQVLPLRQQVSDEVLLRYNGMLLSVFDLLADARARMSTVVVAMQAERDFWLAHTDLQLALTGSSPGGMAVLQSPAIRAETTEQGH